VSLYVVNVARLYQIKLSKKDLNGVTLIYYRHQEEEEEASQMAAVLIVEAE
jgi:hypothetical protein